MIFIFSGLRIGLERAGDVSDWQTQAYRSSTWRRVTFRLQEPPPMGGGEALDPYHTSRMAAKLSGM